MIYLKETGINIMAIDATFWVAVSFIIFFAALFGATLPPLPEFDMGSLMTVLMGMLGLGGLRTFEKYKKVTK